jgi:NADH-quinone oxidoreductase subunit N
MLLSRAGHEAERIDDFRGLARRSPWFAGVMAVFMFSLAGIPPTVGFYAKLAVLQSLVSTNVPGFIWLAVIAVVLSLLGAFYYLRVVKVMYFDAPEAPFDPRPASLSFVAAATALFTTFFFIFPAPFVGAAQAAAKALFL